MDSYPASDTVVYLFPHGANGSGIIHLEANQNRVTTSSTHPLLRKLCIALDFNIPPRESTVEFVFGSRSDCDIIIPFPGTPLRHFSIMLSVGSGSAKIFNKTDDKIVVDGEVLSKPDQWGFIRDGTSISTATCGFSVKLSSRSREHEEAYTRHNFQHPSSVNPSTSPMAATPCGEPTKLCNRIRGMYIELNGLESMSSGPVCRLADETDGRVYTVKKRRGVDGIMGIQHEAEILRNLYHVSQYRFEFPGPGEKTNILSNSQTLPVSSIFFTRTLMILDTCLSTSSFTATSWNANCQMKASLSESFANVLGALTICIKRVSCIEISMPNPLK